MRLKSVIWLFILFTGFACTTQKADTAEQIYRVNLPDYFPPLPVPDKNPMSEVKIKLGAKLFYDPSLSSDSTVSCATCHLPPFAFTDKRDKSMGVSRNRTTRNSPTLVNLAYHPYFMFDGGIPTLELQPVAPIMHPDEMGFDIFSALDRVRTNPEYDVLSEKAFGDSLTALGMAYALAAFQRALLSYQSPYDHYLQGDKTALSKAQQRGMELFFSDSLNCSACHAGFNFTDYGFYNVGLYVEYADKGRERVTELPDDNGKFKTPTLRNIELTAPYMHDGSIKTLSEVIDFKMSGGVNHANKSKKLHPFVLDREDRENLEAFLISLTDSAFVKKETERRNLL